VGLDNLADKMKNEIQQGAIKYLLLLLVQRIIGIGLFMVSAGTLKDMRGMVNITLYLLVSIVSCFVMYSGHQETLNERGKKQANTKNWDKILLPTLVLLSFYAIYLIAGLGIRFDWNRLPIEWFFIGTFLYIVSCVFCVVPVMQNKHFESTSRIQNDRKQEVITTGLYQIVRHPGYAGIVLWAIATALMFGTLAVGFVSLAIIVVICIRTFLEDKMLIVELDGYAEYSKKVKYRLFPFIW
jgi:protein-S-isoprenylcysteine O-methyltransferase Ste14